jgi:hypothetical protein
MTGKTCVSFGGTRSFLKHFLKHVVVADGRWGVDYTPSSLVAPAINSDSEGNRNSPADLTDKTSITVPGHWQPAAPGFGRQIHEYHLRFCLRPAAY